MRRCYFRVELSLGICIVGFHVALPRVAAISHRLVLERPFRLAPQERNAHDGWDHGC